MSMRQKLIGKNLSGRDFSNREIEGYFRDCDFSNCNFTSSTIKAVATNCKFDGSNFTYTRLLEFYTPKSTFLNCIFKKPLTHDLLHKLAANFKIEFNHQIIAEIGRQWI